jgi:predicted AAA+ superfamily ATPase
MATYIERDVRQMVNVRDLSAFRRFVRMCAARTAQQLNLSALAADCGVTHNTAKAWISILEASYIVMLLPPHRRNFGKRLVKTPKLYFYDSGLSGWLAGVENPGQLATGVMRGPLFETWAVSEFVKYRCNHAVAPELYFWRDSTGREIDLLVERGGRLLPTEIKAGQTIAPDWLDSLTKFLQLSRGSDSRLLYAGEAIQARGSVRILGWKEVEEAARWALGGP